MKIEIWQPKWSTRTVLIAKHKVHDHNTIVFTKTPSYPGEYYLSRETIEKYPIVTNGVIDCYSVSLDELTPLEGKEANA